MNANQVLKKAQNLIDQRGRDYDYEDGERSMPDAVHAFNTITGHRLSQGDGWLLMGLVKAVRSCHSPGHVDSNLDLVAYLALRAEAECIHDATESLCAGETASEAPEVAETENANVAPVSEGCKMRTISATRVYCPECLTSWRDGETKPCERSAGKRYCGAYPTFTAGSRQAYYCLVCGEPWLGDGAKPCERGENDPPADCGSHVVGRQSASVEGCGAYTIRQAYRAMGCPPPARYGCSKCKQEWREGQAKPCERSENQPQNGGNAEDTGPKDAGKGDEGISSGEVWGTRKPKGWANGESP